MRRGLTTYLRISLTGDSKRGRAAVPFRVDRRKSPYRGRIEPPTPSILRLRLTGRLGRRDGREAQSTGRPTGRPFLCRRGRGVGWSHEGSREAEEASEEGRAEVAEGEAQRETREEARQHLHGLGLGRRHGRLLRLLRLAD